MSYQICVRLPDEIYEKVKKQSDVEHRTVSNMVIAILADKYKEEQGSDD